MLINWNCHNNRIKILHQSSSKKGMMTWLLVIWHFFAKIENYSTDLHFDFALTPCLWKKNILMMTSYHSWEEGSVDWIQVNAIDVCTKKDTLLIQKRGNMIFTLFQYIWDIPILYVYIYIFFRRMIAGFTNKTSTVSTHLYSERRCFDYTMFELFCKIYGEKFSK